MSKGDKFFKIFMDVFYVIAFEAMNFFFFAGILYKDLSLAFISPIAMVIIFYFMRMGSEPRKEGDL